MARNMTGEHECRIDTHSDDSNNNEAQTPRPALISHVLFHMRSVTRGHLGGLVHGHFQWSPRGSCGRAYRADFNQIMMDTSRCNLLEIPALLRSCKTIFLTLMVSASKP